MTTPHKCPCCDGAGSIKIENDPRDSADVLVLRRCSECGGSGWIFLMDAPATQQKFLGFPVASWNELRAIVWEITQEQDPAKQARVMRERMEATKDLATRGLDGPAPAALAELLDDMKSVTRENHE